MDSNETQRVPAIAIDLDGVIWYQGLFIDGSAEALRLLCKDLSQIDNQKFPNLTSKIPFHFVTNSGATSEQKTADLMNEKLQLKDLQNMISILRERIPKENFILNYTPLRDDLIQFADKVVLVSGFDNTVEIMETLGLKYYVTMEEYARLYPQLVPNNRFSKDDMERTKMMLQARLGDINLEPFLQVHAILLSYISNHVEIVTQLICDVLSTSDGRISKSFPEEAPVSHIPVYSVANDYFFPSRDFNVKRLGWGMYMDAISYIYKKTYKKDLQVVMCGKPSLLTFEFAQKRSIAYANQHGMQISKHYMIGDNPNTDIQGAKNLGWETILVRTGVYKSGPFDSEAETPHVVVENFKEAIEYIFKREQITCQI